VGAHLGLVSDDLTAKIGGGVSKRVGDVVGEVNIVAYVR
jgi:hypothetical protein